jgi:Mor family transcriptional regulator
MKYNMSKLKSGMMPNETLAQIADEIGMDNLIKLTRIIGGRTFYFPKEDTLLSQFRKDQLQKEFTGYNAHELAKKYDVTERWVKEICRPGNISRNTSKNSS